MKLKDWVVNLIILIQILIMVGLSADADSTKVFIISKIILLIPFILNHIILCKYSDLFSEVENDNN